jgi:hypothetical protein
MKHHILCALALVLMVGCNEVEDRLTWSPDGKQAALRVDDKLYFMDANGKLSDVVASNVTGAAWLPDGRGLVLTRMLTVDNWKDAESLLPPAEIEAAKTLAKAFLAFGVEGADQLELKHPELASPAVLYLFDTQSNALHEAFQKAKDPAKLEADLSSSRTTQVYEVSIFLLAGKQSRIIERTLTGLSQPLPSPTAPVVAFQTDEKLTVAPLDGSTNRVTVTDKLLGGYGWTPDGKALVYANRISDKDNSDIIVAGITHHLVVETNGALNAGQKLPLSMNASTFTPRVKCLPDGRALFAGQSLQLPSPAEAASAAHFYLIDPALGTNATPVAIPGEAGSLPQNLAAFAPSPDGRQVAIVESGSDSVAVLDVKTGALDVVSPKRGWKSKVLPAWRSTNELYFAALPASSTNRPELFRWRKGSAPQAVSTNWPDAVVNSLLEKPNQK